MPSLLVITSKYNVTLWPTSIYELKFEKETYINEAFVIMTIVLSDHPK